MEDLRKLVGQREELKSEVKELRALVEGVVGKLDKLVTPPPQAPEQQAPTGIEAQVKQLADLVGGIVAKDVSGQKAERRKTITDAVVAAANEQSRELVRGALATLALDGAIDLHAENTSAEAERALAKLRASYPAHFAQPTSVSPAGGPEIIHPNKPLHERTREELARMTPEEFSKARKAARTSGLAV